MKLSNNSFKLNKNTIEKNFSDKERIKREKYFYIKFKNKKLDIPKVLQISRNKITFQKYQFKKVKSQKLFFNALNKFLIKINKEKKYNLNAKENLKSYKLLHTQVKQRFMRLSRLKIEKKYSVKMKVIKLYIQKVLQEKHKNFSLKNSNNIISQSDIGFHNCAMYKNKVFFYDFEYAGVDNPIKLICDVYYQPEKKIEKRYILRFINKLERSFKFKLPTNFYIFEKLLKAKMMLIILNIFVPSNISSISNSVNVNKIMQLKSKRLNKALSYIRRPFIYEK